MDQCEILSFKKQNSLHRLARNGVFAGGVCCFIPGSLTAHCVGHCRDEGIKEVRSHGPATEQISMVTSLSQLDVLSHIF